MEPLSFYLTGRWRGPLDWFAFVPHPQFDDGFENEATQAGQPKAAISSGTAVL